MLVGDISPNGSPKRWGKQIRKIDQKTLELCQNYV